MLPVPCRRANGLPPERAWRLWSILNTDANSSVAQICGGCNRFRSLFVCKIGGNKEMLALVCRGEGHVELAPDHPRPVPTPGWAVVRVLRAGICTTDLELIAGYLDFRGVLGHEFCGVVEESPGDRWWEGR